MGVIGILKQVWNESASFWLRLARATTRTGRVVREKTSLTPEMWCKFSATQPSQLTSGCLSNCLWSPPGLASSWKVVRATATCDHAPVGSVSWRRGCYPTFAP
eukprot:153065-Alexandrium_andersonii.AAC.1